MNADAKNNVMRAKMRSWLRGHRKPVIFAVIVFFVLTVIAAVGYKANFGLKDDLNVELSGPSSLHVVRNIPFVLNYSFTTLASEVCTEDCSWRVVDARKSVIIRNGTVVVRPGREQAVRVEEVISARGEGVVPFVFEVRCENRPTIACQTWGTKAYMSMLTLVSYSLSDAESVDRVLISTLAPELFDRVNAAANAVQSSRLLVAELSKRSVEEALSVSPHLEIVESDVPRVVDLAMKVHASWNVQDYVMGESALDDLNASIGRFETSVKLVSTSVQDTAIQYDAAMINLTALILSRADIADAMLFYGLQNMSEERDWRSLLDRIEQLADAPSGRIFRLRARVDELSSMYDSLRPKFLDDQLAFADRLSAHLAVNSVERALFEGVSPNVFISQASLGELCLMIPAVNDSPLEDDRLRLREFALDYVNASLNESVGARLLSYFNESSRATTFNVSMIDSPLSDPWLAMAARVCARKAVVSAIILPSLVGVPAVVEQDYVNTSLSSHSPLCCSLGSCSPCCAGCNHSEPVIFLHGHSFSQKTSPLFSLNFFGPMQLQFMDWGYLDAGVIAPSQESIAPGSWGVFSSPITVRTSYYYYYPVDVGEFTIRKDEGIENYALRLRQIVDIVRARTGSQKVDIVAHSMGGLVAREYIALFGEDYVDDLVLIGTPNNGIVGRTANVCSVTGNTLECRDMAAGSPLLVNLNKVPLKSVHVTTIRAEGCDTDGQPGDGLIHGASVVLPYANNLLVNGSCTDAWGTDLHNNLIDPEKMPIVVNLTIAALD